MELSTGLSVDHHMKLIGRNGLGKLKDELHENVLEIMTLSKEKREMLAERFPVNTIEATHCKHIVPILWIPTRKFLVQNGNNTLIPYHNISCIDIAMRKHDRVGGAKLCRNLEPIH